VTLRRGWSLVNQKVEKEPLKNLRLINEAREISRHAVNFGP